MWKGDSMETDCLTQESGPDVQSSHWRDSWTTVLHTPCQLGPPGLAQVGRCISGGVQALPTRLLQGTLTEAASRSSIRTGHPLPLPMTVSNTNPSPRNHQHMRLV